MTCTWINTQNCDAETLSDIAREMSDIFYSDRIEIEDSKHFMRLCIDMTLAFQLLHYDKDWEEGDFMIEIIKFTNRVKKKLLAQKNWINNDYKWAYGNEDVFDLLSK